MKKSFFTILTLLVVSLFSSNSFGGQAEIRGAIIGAGSGAIIGGIIGGTPESAIVGSAIGGAIGATAGHYHRRGIPLPPPIILPPPPRPPHPHVRWHRHKHRHHISHPIPRCRIHHRTIWRHGHPTTITEEVCDSSHRHHRHDHYPRHERRVRYDSAGF